MIHLQCIAINEKLFLLTHAILKHLREGHLFQNKECFWLSLGVCFFNRKWTKSWTQQSSSRQFLWSYFQVLFCWTKIIFLHFFLAFQCFLAQLLLCCPYLSHRETEISIRDISVRLLFFRVFFFEVMWISFSFGVSIASTKGLNCFIHFSVVENGYYISVNDRQVDSNLSGSIWF